MTDHDNLQPLDASEDIGSNPTANRTIGDIVDARLSRRSALQGLFATTAAVAVGANLPGFGEAQAAGVPMAKFKEIPHGYDTNQHVAEGHDIQTLIRWGDAVESGAAKFDPNNQSVAAQEKQFGYNCDFVGFLPLPAGSRSADHGLLFVNHEYTSSNLMFAGLGAGRDAALKTTKAQAETEIASHGASVIEIRRSGGKWAVVENSKYNRRITGTTPISVSGPARGHEKLKTSGDPSGMLVLGTLNNCAGGVTPWGTVVTGEENFNGYFGGDAEKMPQAASYKRYGVSKAAWYSWPKHIERFDVTKEPNEPNRFGYMVEIDPYEPGSAPVKRTAMGRFKHEGAHSIVDKSGHVVFYMGDDERFDYVYRFVTKGKFNARDRKANLGLLDEGTLSVAKFSEDGSVTWLPLIQGQGPLTPANGFNSQADVCIETRRAADLVGATPMDRPEDVEPNPVTGKVYLLLTNNTSRKAEQINKMNPRASNAHGQIIELIPPGGEGKNADHTAAAYKWEMLLVAGDPAKHPGTQYGKGQTADGWLSCPDMCAIDSKGRLWVGTDGAPTAAKIADAVYAVETSGPNRGLSRQFYRAPTGAEICGPCFTPDDSTLFLAIQHPAEDPGSTFENPSTRWPDFQANMPPRPSVVAITRKGGGPLGA